MAPTSLPAAPGKTGMPTPRRPPTPPHPRASPLVLRRLRSCPPPPAPSPAAARAGVQACAPPPAVHARVHAVAPAVARVGSHTQLRVVLEACVPVCALPPPAASPAE
eukprot:5075455-Pleurochrysis_carterae.AAC.2